MPDDSNTVNTTATPAPLLTPNKPGSANGFSNKACIIAPVTARAAPITMTVSVRGKRICQTKSCAVSFIHWLGQYQISPALSDNIAMIKREKNKNTIKRMSDLFCFCNPSKE